MRDIDKRSEYNALYRATFWTARSTDPRRRRSDSSRASAERRPSRIHTFTASTRDHQPERALPLHAPLLPNTYHIYAFSGLKLRTALPARQISISRISSISFSNASR